VRQPTDRWASDLAFSSWNVSADGTYDREWGDWFGQPATSPAELVATFTAGGRRRDIAWTEELLHKQPQAWYVWDEAGHVQCHCVVPFESIGQFAGNASIRKAAPRGHHAMHNNSGLPAALRPLYGLDAELWSLAHKHTAHQKDASVCYRPPPLWNATPMVRHLAASAGMRMHAHARGHRRESAR
jgi:hypothetical protein